MTLDGNCAERPASGGGPTDSDEASLGLLDRLCDTHAEVVYFPVRHHSPACAALLGEWIERERPATILIEGPSDFNEHRQELLLDHELPIAIYTYFRDGHGTQGAYYPFCAYSPEWVALKAGRACGAEARFIDLPWRQIAGLDAHAHRYADAELRRGRYVRELCRQMQVEDFDDLWDKIVEQDPKLDLGTYLTRVHSFCFHTRLWEHEISLVDQRREAFMAEQIRRCRRDVDGTILVVTGGFHSSALLARCEGGFPCPGVGPDEQEQPAAGSDDAVERGIALTPYSYEQLDSLTGYDAGMPNPGFYEHVWKQKGEGGGFRHQALLGDLVRELRRRRQVLSTADLIAVETSARALAALRGRPHVWRRDLIDAVTSALIKDELEYGCQSPFVDAVHAVLRGERRGRLAEGTRVPPLVEDIQRQLADARLASSQTRRTVELDLLVPEDLQKSRLLHRLLILGVGGYERVAGTDFLLRDDLSQLWETWQIRWTPTFQSSCIEASCYGVCLADAVGACMLENTRAGERDAAAAAALLVQAAQGGIETVSEALFTRLAAMIKQEPEFAGAAEALGHLLFLFCFEEALGTADLPGIGAVLKDAFGRSLWLLELLGESRNSDPDLVHGMQSLMQACRRTATRLDLDEDEFTAVLRRVQTDDHKPAQIRGAAAGILWTLGAAEREQVLRDLRVFSDPGELGDYLTGLFGLARETAQRDADLVQSIDQLLAQFSADDFQEALPSLRLAFTFFTPREKHHMLATLFQTLGLEPRNSVPLDLAVDAASAAAALALEERLFEALNRYGLGEDQ